MTLCLLAGAAAFVPGSSLPFAPQQVVQSAATAGFDGSTMTSPLRTVAHICMVQSSTGCSDDLRTFLTARAQVSPAYVDKVLEICDEEMIGSVDNLQTAAELGMLATLFKPVVAMGIQSALADVGAAGRAPSVAGVAAQIKDMLEDERQELKPDAAAQPELAGAAAYATPLAVAQRGLEVEPYWDMLPHLPMNTFKPKRPHLAAIASVKRIVGANAPGEVCHVVIETGGAVRYWEGQSLGVKPSGDDPKTGKPNSVRLYSIASSRYGDDGGATSVSLCVRRAVYWDAALGAEDPAKKGVCSNFMCDARPQPQPPPPRPPQPPPHSQPQPQPPPPPQPQP